MQEQDKVVWLGLREIYRLLGTPEGNTLVRILLRKKDMRTNELIVESKIPPPKFHNIMRSLVMCQVLDRKVHDDRSVSYNISPFGKNVLELSEPILDKIRDKMKDKESALLTLVQQKVT